MMGIHRTLLSFADIRNALINVQVERKVGGSLCACIPAVLPTSCFILA